jgi:hypothetical protein
VQDVASPPALVDDGGEVGSMGSEEVELGHVLHTPYFMYSLVVHDGDPTVHFVFILHVPEQVCSVLA